MNLEYLTGPLVGAVIGYFTNYLAVKMLFRPKKEVYILGHKLPFTPGAIPKGKPRLAKAIGNIVANTLLTEEDIRKQFITEENKQLVVGKVVELCNQKVGQDIRALVDTEEEYLGLKEKISEFLNEKIMHAIQRMDIEAIFAKESGRILKEKTAGTMLQMFVMDDLIASITAPIGEEIVKFIENNGRDYIQPEIDSGIETLEDMSLLELAEHCDIKQEQVKEIISKNYERIVNAGIEKAMEKLDIAGMIEEKINGMNVDELEQLVLAVMKKELDVIVNLGALIGALLGVINIFY